MIIFCPMTGGKRRSAREIWLTILRWTMSLPLNSNIARTGPRPSCLLQFLLLTRN